MANYIKLLDKGTQDVVSFIDIDEEMCRHFGVVPDEIDYYRDWYNTLAFSLACGKTYDQLRRDWPGMIDIIDYLETKYIPYAYGGR